MKFPHLSGGSYYFYEGLRTPGSSAVGSRLAYNAENSSPCASPSQEVVSSKSVSSLSVPYVSVIVKHVCIADVRTIHSYRSLPRPSKARLNDDEVTFLKLNLSTGRWNLLLYSAFKFKRTLALFTQCLCLVPSLY